MKRLEPVDDLRCPLCGRGFRLGKLSESEKQLLSFRYDCRCGFVLPVPRVDEAGAYVNLATA